LIFEFLSKKHQTYFSRKYFSLIFLRSFAKQGQYRSNVTLSLSSLVHILW
jgi:hypothetical protein